MQRQKNRTEPQGRSCSPWVCYFVPPQLSSSLRECGGGWNLQQSHQELLITQPGWEQVPEAQKWNNLETDSKQRLLLRFQSQWCVTPHQPTTSNGQNIAKKLFGKGFQHHYQSAVKQLMNFLIFYHPLASFGPKIGDHNDVKEHVGGSTEVSVRVGLWMVPQLWSVGSFGRNGRLVPVILQDLFEKNSLVRKFSAPQGHFAEVETS